MSSKGFDYCLSSSITSYASLASNILPSAAAAIATCTVTITTIASAVVPAAVSTGLVYTAMEVPFMKSA